MKHIAYCRKSSESEEKQVQSIDSQTTALNDLAAKQGFIIDKIFTEEMSAKKPGRPFFADLLKFIQKHPGSVLLTWKLDRLARNPVDFGQISWLLQNGIISEIKTPFGSYYPTDNVLVATVEFGMANQYIRDLSVNVKRGNKTKLENGGWPGCAPLGYLNDKLNKTTYPDPERAHYIKETFELYATGAYSLNSLANHLYEKGFRSKAGFKVHANQIHRILMNPFYFGVMQRSGRTYPGAHTQIISQTLFEQVQASLTGKSHSARQKHRFPLRGFLRCAQCGCLITAEKQRGHVYYHCTNGKQCCDQKKQFVRSEQMDEQILSVFGKLKLDLEFIEIMYLASKEKNQRTNITQEKSFEAVQQNLDKLALRRSRLEDMYLDEKISEDSFNAKLLALGNEETLLKTQLSKLQRLSAFGADDTFEQTKNVFLKAHYAQSDYYSGNDDKKLEVIKTVLSNATVKDRKIQDCQLKMPYQAILAGHQNKEFSYWLGR